MCSLRKHAVYLLTDVLIHKKHDIVDIKEMDTLPKGMSHKCCHDQTGRVYHVARHGFGIVVS